MANIENCPEGIFIDASFLADIVSVKQMQEVLRREMNGRTMSKTFKCTGGFGMIDW